MKGPVALQRIRIELAEVEPVVWRTVQVPEHFTLWQFHYIVEAAMGWEGYHLHSFPTSDLSSGTGEDQHGERAQTLDRFWRPGTMSSYRYDFGDLWEHHLIFEERSNGRPGTIYPLCVAGRRACPPEDSGGPWIYQEYLQARRRRRIPRDLRERMGKNFNPADFDRKTVNATMHEWLVDLASDSA